MKKHLTHQCAWEASHALLGMNCRHLCLTCKEPELHHKNDHNSLNFQHFVKIPKLTYSQRHSAYAYVKTLRDLLYANTQRMNYL